MGIHVLRDDTHLSRWIENGKILGLGCHEISLYANYIPEGGVVIDAGACLGDHAQPFAQLVGPAGHVYAYEPNPLVYEALAKNMAVFNNVTTLPLALGAEPSDVAIKSLPNVGASFVAEVGMEDSVRVKSVTLDEHLLPNISRCDFIHLDVEGREPFVIRGAVKLLAKFRPAMVLECAWNYLARYGENEGTLRETLAKAGYCMKELYATPHSFERNVICLPVEP